MPRYETNNQLETIVPGLQSVIFPGGAAWLGDPRGSRNPIYHSAHALSKCRAAIRLRLLPGSGNANRPRSRSSARTMPCLRPNSFSPSAPVPAAVVSGLDSYSVPGPVEKVVPVSYYIPGCPPRPEAIIYGVAVAPGLVDKKTAPVEFKQMEFPIPRYYPRDLRRDGNMVVYEKLEKV